MLRWLSALAMLLFCGPVFAGTGQSYTYQLSDVGTTVVRSDSCATMDDYMLLGHTTGLNTGNTITITNGNAPGCGYLYLYGTRIDPYTNYGYHAGGITLVTGGAEFGGGCATCLSVAFIAPGETIQYTYTDTLVAFPNGTVGNVEGGQIDYAFSGWIWSATVLTQASATPTPAAYSLRTSLGWTLYPEPGANEDAQVNVWGQVWSFNNSGHFYSAAVSNTSILREQLRDGDQWWDEINSCPFCERSLVQTNTLLTNNVVYWAARSFYWPCTNPVAGSDYAKIGNYWVLLDALHSNVPLDGNARVPIQTEMLFGGYLAINLRWESSLQNYVYISPAPLVCGVWHDIVQQWMTSYPTNGFMNEWFDGVQIVNYVGPLGDPNDTPYCEMEIYRSNYDHGSTGQSGQYTGPANTYTDYFSNVQCGSANLSARITHPPFPINQTQFN